jgi:hypothetical protein
MGNARGAQRLEFLARPAENHRVATLQAHHLPALPAQLHEEVVDLRLRGTVMPGPLADGVDFAAWRTMSEQLITGEFVVHHGLGGL